MITTRALGGGAILRRFAGALFWLALAGMFLAVAGPSAAEGKYGGSWGLPDDYSTHGHKIDKLFYVILWVTGIVFVLTEVALVWFLFKYRRRDGRKAKYTHGSTAVEAVWTVVPAVIILSMAFSSRALWKELKQDMPPDALNLKVVGEQFAWNVLYPGPDGMLDTADDMLSLNIMHIPVHKPVVVTLTSKDVIHSFFLPEFRVKQDAVPGMTSQVWVEATQTGTFDIACAELCGLGHYRMKGYLMVDTPEDYESFLAELAEEQEE